MQMQGEQAVALKAYFKKHGLDVTVENYWNMVVVSRKGIDRHSWMKFQNVAAKLPRSKEADYNFEGLEIDLG